MREKYTPADMEVIGFDSPDVITASDGCLDDFCIDDESDL